MALMFLDPIIILLSFVYLNFASGNENGLLTQQECTINCAYKVAFLRENYNDCMLDCTDGNWLLISAGQCIGSPNSYRQEQSASVCAPVDVRFQEVQVHNNVTDITHGYLVLSWLPCPAGIDDVIGFQVTFVDKHYFADNCYNVNLTKTLNNENRKTRFSIVWPHKLSFLSEIHTMIRPLPITTVDDHKTYAYISESCVTLNGPGTCACGLKGLRQSKTTAPQVTVQGYTLHVVMPVLKSCFEISGYQLAVTRKSSNNYFLSNIKTEYFRSPMGQSFNHSFFPVYNSPDQDIIKVSCTLIGKGEPKVISSSRVTVKAWLAQPQIEVLSPGVIKVSFSPAGDEYKILAYLVRLNSHPEAKYNNLSVPTNSQISNLTSADLEGGMLSTTYYHLGPSVYTIQVKEYRLPSMIFSEAEWSKSIEIVIKNTSGKTNPVIVSVVLVTGILTIFAAIFVISMFLWKKGKCSDVRHYMPGHVTQWLDSQAISDISLRQRTVFIVWKYDTRSQLLGEKHAEIIRHLASYLSQVCGLHVILDMWEEHIVSIGACSWIQTSLENAEFVLFVCPHFHNEDKLVENTFSPSVVGDFNKIYSYIEPRLGDRKKYITLLLPYGDPVCCKSTKWLASMTRSYKIMDQIEDLYFHIQEHSKVNLSGRHSVQYISSKDYHLTPEGQAFRDGVLSFMEVSLSADMSCSSQTSLEDEENSGDALLENQEEIDLKNCIGVIPPAPYPTSLPLTIHPPPPLLSNPEEHIRLTNNALPVNQIEVRSSSLKQTQCPYHSDMITNGGVQNHPDEIQMEFQPTPTSISRSSFASMGSVSSFHNSSGRNSTLEELNIQGLASGDSFDLKGIATVEIMSQYDTGFAESPA